VSRETDLLVVGAGAKGAAVAAKAHALNHLGITALSVTVVEAVEPAAAWLDGNGVTSSREVLAISPAKDVGFPYESGAVFGEAGEEIDEAVLSFSWQRYLVERGDYSRWVNAGSPAVQRRIYGEYLTWVLAGAQAGVSVARGRVTRISLSPDGAHWLVDVEKGPEVDRYACGALLLTGPGVHRRIAHDAAAAPRLLDCDRGRLKIAGVPIEDSSDIAIVGGGESALSCVEFVRALRPDALLSIYTPGLPTSRIESFLENRVFSNPDSVGWRSLSVQARRDFIARTDRGVFGPERVAELAYDERCRFIAGRVLHVGALPGGRGVCVQHESPAGVASANHDYVINCTGFDQLEQLRALVSCETRAEIERRVGPVWDPPPEADIAIGRCLELDGLHPRIHLPAVASLSQGPGFANLGSLGLLADRVLMPFRIHADEQDPRSRQRHHASNGERSGARREAGISTGSR